MYNDPSSKLGTIILLYRILEFDTWDLFVLWSLLFGMYFSFGITADASPVR
jgi:hypothetical protein